MLKHQCSRIIHICVGDQIHFICDAMYLFVHLDHTIFVGTASIKNKHRFVKIDFVAWTMQKFLKFKGRACLAHCFLHLQCTFQCSTHAIAISKHMSSSKIIQFICISFIPCIHYRNRLFHHIAHLKKLCLV